MTEGGGPERPRPVCGATCWLASRCTQRAASALSPAWLTSSPRFLG